MLSAVQPRVIVYAAAAHATSVMAALPERCVRVANRAQFAAAARTCAVAFVDIDLLYQVDHPDVPVIAIVGPDDALAKTVRSLGMFPWLEHVVAASLLSSASAPFHLETLIDRLCRGTPSDLLGSPGVGRVALLAQASRREERFEKMRQFFAERALPDRALRAISEISEELVTNALYDAPLEAGYFAEPVQRSDDVSLPNERACEISYGFEQDTPFVRVRDTFGAFARDRLLAVLTRCNNADVRLDSSRGGAGLGLWRVLAHASTVAITVVRGRLTDILVGVSTSGRRAGRQLQALHLFFGKESNARMEAIEAENHPEMFDNSITLMLA